MLFLMFFILPPPSSLPDLYPLLITSFCCLHYIGFLIYIWYLMMNMKEKNKKKTKKKMK